MGEDRIQVGEKLRADVEATLMGAGLHVLEFTLSRPRNAVQVKAVIYSPKGTGTKECAQASRLILPRLQLLLGVQDAVIEISSPGIDRVFKSVREWDLFTGKAVKFLLKGEETWQEGRLLRVEQGRAYIEGPKGPFTFDIADVAKARLDSTHAGE